MLNFISTGFLVLTISVGSCFWSCDTNSVLTNETDHLNLIGKANPKFKCVDLCTSAVGVCNGNGTTCANGNVGVHCGDGVITKQNFKQCVEDPDGGVDPCVNDTNVNCYTIKPCWCTARVVNGKVVYQCQVIPNAKIQNGGAVVRSKQC